MNQWRGNKRYLVRNQSSANFSSTYLITSILSLNPVGKEMFYHW